MTRVASHEAIATRDVPIPPAGSTGNPLESGTDRPPAPTPSQHGGMGAIPYDGGTVFRVWAPFAEKVFVMGPFNGWSKDGNPLAPEENGYWSADVEGAGVGDEYAYVIINDDQVLERADPYARQMTNSVGRSVVHDPTAFDWEGDAFQLPPWNELVLYEMHIGTFNDMNPKGPGNLRMSINKLDYLKDLGINAVEIMPLAEFAGDFSWGYNPSFTYAVESAYGGPRAFKEFIREAHKRGIAVILDVVYNHFGPSDLDLWRFDGWYEGQGGGIYFYNDHRAETPWGLTRPDYGRPEVRRYIRDNVMMWLDEYRLDGLRWDGTVFIRYKGFFKEPGTELPDGYSLMQEINREVQETRPGKLMIAEDLQDDACVTQPVSEGGLGFGTQWDAKFVHPIREAIIAPEDEARDLMTVRDALLNRYGEDAFRRIIYTESHDEVANGKARVAYEINRQHAESWESKKRSTLGATLVLTSPGIPMLFQGQELLETEWFRDTEPLDWTRLAQMPGIYRLYRDLIRLRRNADGVTRGLMGQGAEVYHLNNDLKLLTMQRWDQGGPGDSTLIVVNFANRAHDAYRVGFPASGIWRIRFNSASKLYSEDFTDYEARDVEAEARSYDGLPASAEISIGPYTGLIYSQDPGQ